MTATIRIPFYTVLNASVFFSDNNSYISVARVSFWSSQRNLGYTPSKIKYKLEVITCTCDPSYWQGWDKRAAWLQELKANADNRVTHPQLKTNWIKTQSPTMHTMTVASYIGSSEK